MTLKVFENDGTRYFLTAVFKIKCFTFQRLRTKFVELFEKCSYDWLVVNGELRQCMAYLCWNIVSITYNDYARYATDVILHQSFRPCRIIQKIYNILLKSTFYKY